MVAVELQYHTFFQEIGHENEQDILNADSRTFCVGNFNCAARAMLTGGAGRVGTPHSAQTWRRSVLKRLQQEGVVESTLKKVMFQVWGANKARSAEREGKRTRWTTCAPNPGTDFRHVDLEWN